jgi:hypothetical protein
MRGAWMRFQEVWNMAAKTKSAEAELVTLKPIRIKRVEIKVAGDTSLIVHKWSQKAIRMILDKQMKKASGGRDVRDPEQEFANTLYFIKGEPEELTPETLKKAVGSGAQFGFPSTGFKQSAVSAGYRSGMTKDKVSVMGHFHIDGDFVPLKGVPVMRTDMVRLGGMGSPADIRFRAEFREWSAIIPVRYNEAAISAEQLVNLFNVAGFSVGVGEWRPEKNGNHGMFHVTG